MTQIYEIHDPRFRFLHIGSAGLDRLWTGARWTEGPVWFNDLNCLIFSDIPNQRLLRWVPDDLSGNGPGGAVSVFRQPSGFGNGHTRDRAGRLVSCQHGSRSVTRTEVDGTISVIADAYRGKRLNSPNDVVVHSDGSIWFTDPSYGIMSDYEGYRADEEQPARHVFRCDPSTRAIDAVADDFGQPNGLCFSPDESLLYIADSAASHDPEAPPLIRVFDVQDGKLRNGRAFARIDTGFPDGIRCDTGGRIWSSAADGVHCFDPDGTLLGKVLVPETVANLCFGGQRRNRMFITATTSIYSIYLTVTGTQFP